MLKTIDASVTEAVAHYSGVVTVGRGRGIGVGFMRSFHAAPRDLLL